MTFAPRLEGIDDDQTYLFYECFYFWFFKVTWQVDFNKKWKINFFAVEIEKTEIKFAKKMLKKAF